ncbi:hypothetical protein BVG16_11555 [Paenibacillus selenitireducens]|uniref:Uncharacterized protein n=1 Tax=Paenibacillus selenitireducens TaxID=1324314 RepID=A0A1T2XF71_9BACL|nr:hypothetical protein [Paenibacillus selenitireducens]OPA78500.1 hypothetical protein BVG16_11555 [Paenibacillus selenitireducens]
MNINNTFEVSKKITALADKYNELSTKASDEVLKNVYAEMTFQLDEIYAELLQISNHYPDDKNEKIVTIKKSIDGLSSDSELTLLHEYEHENLALVEDTSMEVYLVPLDVLKQE